ncbi:vitamin B12 ABC transporter substrate-binding protein BtuF [Pluralibacter gergoviae]|uniref:vitamin B12 ABC transporter substrate-binding protein BtuF n=1 Tax=Pluralibacter gergoviae TaxID=61647 RepID=UPI0006523FE9|nr:vitamin B12 ABC transporter substrate-binding protein BtuF [Pluralibacter gergoviae]KMK10438.1 vitamin B12-transporter protein BtuF [Pluralibacter gergoviae]
MAKILARSLFALLLFPAWLFAAPRVVTLSPANAELAFAAGITPVGVSSYSDYPPQAADIEQVANWQGINVERILALKPDVVLAWRSGNAERQVNQLSALGVKVLWIETGSVEQIADALRQLAAYSPQPQTARAAADSMLNELHALRARYADGAKKRVFMQFGSNPLFTSNKDSIQNQILQTCGAENIFADSRVPWPQVSREQVLIRRPQAIVATGDEAAAGRIRQFWRDRLTVPVITVNSDWFERPSPRIILAAKQLCAALARLN